MTPLECKGLFTWRWGTPDWWSKNNPAIPIRLSQDYLMVAEHVHLIAVKFSYKRKKGELIARSLQSGVWSERKNEAQNISTGSIKYKDSI